MVPDLGAKSASGIVISTLEDPQQILSGWDSTQDYLPGAYGLIDSSSSDILLRMSLTGSSSIHNTSLLDAALTSSNAYSSSSHDNNNNTVSSSTGTSDACTTSTSSGSSSSSSSSRSISSALLGGLQINVDHDEGGLHFELFDDGGGVNVTLGGGGTAAYRIGDFTDHANAAASEHDDGAVNRNSHSSSSLSSSSSDSNSIHNCNSGQESKPGRLTAALAGMRQRLAAATQTSAATAQGSAETQDSRQSSSVGPRPQDPHVTNTANIDALVQSLQSKLSQTGSSRSANVNMVKGQPGAGHGATNRLAAAVAQPEAASATPQPAPATGSLGKAQAVSSAVKSVNTAVKVAPVNSQLLARKAAMAVCPQLTAAIMECDLPPKVATAVQKALAAGRLGSKHGRSPSPQNLSKIVSRWKDLKKSLGAELAVAAVSKEAAILDIPPPTFTNKLRSLDKVIGWERPETLRAISSCPQLLLMCSSTMSSKYQALQQV